MKNLFYSDLKNKECVQKTKKVSGCFNQHQPETFKKKKE
jgi:hypothetical protein